MKNRFRTLFQRFVAFLIDATVALFIFQVVALICTYFYFIPIFPGLWVVWIAYYIVVHTIFGKTLGEAVLGLGIATKNSGTISVIQIFLREALVSIPAIIFWLTCWHRIDILRTILILLLAIILLCLKKKLFGVRIEECGVKPTYKPCFIYLVIIILGLGARFINTIATNDNTLSADQPLGLAPRPTVHSVEKYVDFLKDNRQNINDYVMNLFDEYDHVILCERLHPEVTQYDMIYNLVSDPRFVDKVGVVFTEIGCVESRDAYKNLLNTTFENDTLMEKALTSFLMENQSVHLLWPNTNWHNFLKRIYYLNQGKEKKVNILFADKNWIDRMGLEYRDSIMADNIISTIKSDSLSKSLTIMNYRHAFLTPGQGNCGYYIERSFPGKVTNVMFNFATIDFISMLTSPNKETIRPIQNGRWDVAFEQIPDDEFAFDFSGSPFGNDKFDFFPVPWAKENDLKYQDMFRGLIYYKSPAKQYTSTGFPYLFDSKNIRKLEERERQMPGYSLSAYDYLKQGNHVVGAQKIYNLTNQQDNTWYVRISIFSILLVMILFLYIKIQRNRTRDKFNSRSTR